MPRSNVTPIIVCSGNGRGALPVGIRILAQGGTALDAVEACSRIIEADPTDRSVGRGGLPNVLGEVELDASIMDGTSFEAGSVSALTGYLHPITVARAVMEQLPHVMLVGAGAKRFAAEIGAERADLLTPESRALWVERLAEAGQTPASIARATKLAPIVGELTREERGTVNFLAVDRSGDFASAVTTSGWGYKYPGRIGDSPVIGAGHYADSRYGAAACTGFGELALRTVATKTAVDRLAAGRSVQAVAEAAIADANALTSHGSRLNIVVLGADGAHAAATTKRGVEYAYQSMGMQRPAAKRRTVVRRSSR